jgi:glucuronoarabinoxylan endo-1,4-beta-xylanase
VGCPYLVLGIGLVGVLLTAIMPWCCGTSKRNEADESSGITLDCSKKYQTIVGFGGSMAYYTNWVYDHPNRDLIYSTIYSELRPSLIRFRNTYALDPKSDPTSRDMTIDAFALSAAKQALGSEPLVLLTSWSPPGYLKDTGVTEGCGTLAKVGNKFCYDEFAKWWVDSVNAYRALGVNPRWVSIQNEPDYSPTSHDGCNFGPREKKDLPGYDRALQATHNLFRDRLSNPPGLVGPEHTGMDGILPGDGELDELEAVGNHMYASGEYDDPQSLATAIKLAGKWSKRTPNKDMFMTEYGKLTSHEPMDALKLASIIHKTLVHGDVTAYWHWDLFWGAGTGEGSLVLVDNPFTGNRRMWANENGFTLTQSFWYYAHFCRFIRPGFQRVRVTCPIDSILVSAYVGPANKACAVVINSSNRSIDGLQLNGLPAGSTEVFQSTLSDRMTSLGSMQIPALPPLPGHSITTVAVN